MTEKKKRFLSLSVKPLFVLLLGLVLGVGAALLAETAGEAIIERCYLSEAAVLKRTNRAAQELQGYVRQNALTTRNTNALAQWGESRKDYYILLYRDQRQILEIGWWGADIAAVDAYSLKEQGAEVVYPEADMAVRIGKRLISGNLLDYIALGDGVEVRRITVGGRMLGKSVRTLDLRKVYGINIIAVEHGQQTNVEFSADYTFKEGDTVAVIGKVGKIDKFEKEM